MVKALSTADNQATVLRNEFVGPQIGKDLAMNGLYATIFMLAGFLIYIAVRFGGSSRSPPASWRCST